MWGMRGQFSNSRGSTLAVGKCLYEPRKSPGGKFTDSILARKI